MGAAGQARPPGRPRLVRQRTLGRSDRLKPLDRRRHRPVSLYQRRPQLDADQPMVGRQFRLSACRPPCHRQLAKLQRKHQSHGLLRQRRWRVQGARYHRRHQPGDGMDPAQQRPLHHAVLQRRGPQRPEWPHHRRHSRQRLTAQCSGRHQLERLLRWRRRCVGHRPDGRQLHLRRVRQPADPPFDQRGALRSRRTSGRASPTPATRRVPTSSRRSCSTRATRTPCSPEGSRSGDRRTSRRPRPPGRRSWVPLAEGVLPRSPAP